MPSNCTETNRYKGKGESASLPQHELAIKKQLTIETDQRVWNNWEKRTAIIFL